MDGRVKPGHDELETHRHNHRFFFFFPKIASQLSL